MADFLGSLGIRTTIYALLALPLMALAGVGGWQAWGNWQAAAEMRRLNALAELAPSISGLVHELQKERGASAIFISRGGQSAAASRLRAQRTETDSQQSKLVQVLESVDPADYGDAFTAGLEDARHAIAKLDAQRGEVAALRHKAADMADYYTGTINEFLEVIGEMPSLSRNAAVTTAIDGYIAFLQAKERAGIERAVGAAGFSKGSFTTELHSRLVDLIGQQHAYFAIFNSHATADQISVYQQALSGSAIDEVERMRKVAIENSAFAGLQGISGAAWFDATTQRINLLKEVEDRLSADLLLLTDGLRAEEQRAFWFQTAFLLILGSVLVCLGAIIANNISRPLVQLTKSITTLAKGDQNIGELPAERADEIGAMSRALAKLRTVSIEAIRAKTSMDSASTCFIIAKNDQHGITYINGAMREMLQQAEADFRQSVPGFSAGALEGSDLQAFLASGKREGAGGVDLNTAHIALNRLKAAAIRHLPYEGFYNLFADASNQRNVRMFDLELSRHLDAETQRYWTSRDWQGRRRISAFARGFYRTGLLGRFIATGHALARMLGGNPAAMVTAKNFEQQREIFEREIRPLLRRPLVHRLLDNRASLFGLGIPPAQYEALSEGRPMHEVIEERLERLACGFDLKDNYFAWQAFNRAYDTTDNGPLPPYLEPTNYDALRERIADVRVLNVSLTSHLAGLAMASVDRFVLLDAQDWMTSDILSDLWHEITRTARPGARVIFRTAGTRTILPDHVPDSILSQWRYETDRSAELGARDRSAIYGGFHLYTKEA